LSAKSKWFSHRAVAKLARRFLKKKIALIPLSRFLYSTWEWEVRRNSDLAKLLAIFAEIDQKTAGLPIGKVRLLWSRKALANADAEIAEIEATYNGAAIAACEQIVKLLGWRGLFGSRAP
jgi:hypothetical protein